VNPAPYIALDASGATAWLGWPKSDAVQTEIANWYAAPDKVAIGGLNQAATDDVVHIPAGFFKGYQVSRKNISGIVKALFLVFWDVSKT
jgi:peptide/nickel transport system substrate-binding protein